MFFFVFKGVLGYGYYCFYVLDEEVEDVGKLLMLKALCFEFFNDLNFKFLRVLIKNKER